MNTDKEDKHGWGKTISLIRVYPLPSAFICVFPPVKGGIDLPLDTRKPSVAQVGGPWPYTGMMKWSASNVPLKLIGAKIVRLFKGAPFLFFHVTAATVAALRSTASR